MTDVDKNLEAYYGLPSEVKFCKKCVTSNQKPNGTREFGIDKDCENKETIHFDEEGVCDACRFAEMKEKIDWEERERELRDLCDQYRSKDGSYDVIVPGSGGKDSGLQAHMLKYKYNMHPLTVTWAPQLFTEIGWQNLMNWIAVGGFDNYLFNPNGRIYRLLTKLAFENLYNPHQPFIMGHKYIGPRMAQMHNIKLVMLGENMSEYGNKLNDNKTPNIQKDVYSIEALDLENIFLGGLSVPELIDRHKLQLNDLLPFLPISEEVMYHSGIEFKYLGYYMKWKPQESYYYAVENTGFKPNPNRTQGSYTKYRSIDDKLYWIYIYTYFVKFGMGKATADASQEIRNQHIDREEGIALVRRYDGEFPSEYFQDFLNYIGITEEQFWERTDRARSPHLWEKINGEWNLKHRVS